VFSLFGRSKNRRISSNELEIKRFIIKTFGYRPKTISYFVEALTHKSYHSPGEEIVPNERLEFLGDAVLDTIVAEYLFKKHPQFTEGDLTKIKSKIVNRASLSNIGESMQIKKYLRFNKARSINIKGLEGNCLEALIGAIYLDGGYKKTKECILTYVFHNYLDVNKLETKEVDFKSKLFIWCQKKHLTLDFEVMEETTENGRWNYTVQAIINNISYGTGTGSSKKSAEQQASEQTLQIIGEE